MFRRLIMAFAALAFIGSANAELKIEITGGINEGHRIAVYQFAQDPNVKFDVASVVAADLMRSGKFAPLSRNNLPQGGVVNGSIDVEKAALSSAEFVVGGIVKSLGNNIYNIEFQLVGLQGANKGKVLAHFGGRTSLATMRQASHRVSDRIYEAVTGQRGCFRTRIAYIVQKRNSKFPYQLMTADYDGYNEVAVVKSTQPIMTPAWSPDGKRIAYVSFEKRKSAIFVQDIVTKKRKILAEFSGLNSSPSWSPDGTKIAMTLSKNGQPDIFYFDLAQGRFVQVTANRAIDTEPTWSADSKALFFTSVRGGKAQIYKKDLVSGKVERVTYQGARNLSAKQIPGTNSLVVITQVNGFRVARVDADGSIYMLTTSTLDESPSVAPNGSMVIYSTVYQGRKGLALVSSDGRFKANLPSSAGEISSPAWGPLLSK